MNAHRACELLLGWAILAGAASAAEEPSAATDHASGLVVERLETRAPEHSRFPRLATDPSGGAHLLYLVSDKTAAPRLELSTFRDGEFAEPVIVASGGDWFVNWADFPNLAVDAAGHVAVCWLEKLGRGTFAYGVRVRTSGDRGATWGDPFWLHEDLSEAEHGFPSLIAEGQGRFRAVWLDGRDMAETGHMTLRTRTFDAEGARQAEVLLDERVCECCVTDLAATADGWLTVYRDRTLEGVRDIQVLTGSGGTTLGSRRVFADDWVIPG